jgi:para-nitrobenzyl esterase
MGISATTVEIDTREGRVRGTLEDDLAIFRGVPFAQAPTRALRFQPPHPPAPFKSVFDATTSAPMCPQPPLRLLAALGELIGEQSEDCLACSIWAPLPLDRPRPILVWVHGGALVTGCGSAPWYDGATLARENDIVVVAPNYRLGALGLLCRPGLVEGNMALLDQIRALEWIKDNAAAFGGDTARITLMGQSAGAGSIALMLALPRVRQLFQRGIFLSGGSLSLPLTSKAEAIAVADQFCAKLDIDPDGTDALRRLQEAPVPRILDAQIAVSREWLRPAGNIMPAFSFAAVGELSRVDALQANIEEGARGIDALLGATAEEMRVFNALEPRLADLEDDDLPKVAEGLLGQSWAADVERARRARPGSTPLQILTDAQTGQSVAGIRQLGLAVAEGKGSAWLYRFDWSTPNSPFGASHCIDLPFFFGTFDAFQNASMLAGGDRAAMNALSRVMRGAVGRFVKNGSPVGEDLLGWPSFGRSQPVEMVFDTLLQRGWVEIPPGIVRTGWPNPCPASITNVSA